MKPSVAAGGDDDHRQQTHHDEDRAEGILDSSMGRWVLDLALEAVFWLVVEEKTL